jgi:hypothetical protein
MLYVDPTAQVTDTEYQIGMKISIIAVLFYSLLTLPNYPFFNTMVSCALTLVQIML